MVLYIRFLVFCCSVVAVFGYPWVEGKPAQEAKLNAFFKDDDENLILVNLNKRTVLYDKVYDSVDNLFFVQFYLFTKQNPVEPQILWINDTETLISSYFNKDLETKIIIHGFLNSVNSATVQHIKNNYLSLGGPGYNVIGLDWSFITYNIVYQLALHEAAPVGAFLGQFIRFLGEQGAPPDSIHLIGHSLGAHVAGFAGASLTPAKVARITGLDPALPGFNSAERSERLDSTDGIFVDCIHTCGGFLGIAVPICTADFYPNNGTNVQPGCSYFDIGSCSHSRSHEIFAESIILDHHFPALTCPQVFPVDLENCKDEGALMGHPASNRLKGIFYATTSSQYPYSPEAVL